MIHGGVPRGIVRRASQGGELIRSRGWRWFRELALAYTSPGKEGGGEGGGDGRARLYSPDAGPSRHASPRESTRLHLHACQEIQMHGGWGEYSGLERIPGVR